MINGWTGSADGTREQRHYYAQNWRADVSAIFDNAGAVIEWQKYSAYGVPFLLTPGDHGKDGGVSAADQTAFNADYAANNARADLNRDGAWTTADQTLFTASYNAAAVGGRWKLSAHVANRKGYAGYEHEGFGNDLAAPELAHVRHRVLHFELGRWTRRDPLGYVDGLSGVAYSRSNPIGFVDPDGRTAVSGPSDGGVIFVSNIIPSVPMTPAQDLGPYPYCNPTMCSIPCRHPGLFGITLCDDTGAKCICVCENTIRRTYPEATNIVESCVIRHEMDHYNRVRCMKLPTGQWQACARYGLYCAECDAHHVELNCLSQSIALCFQRPARERLICALGVLIRMNEISASRDLYCSYCYQQADPPRPDGGWCSPGTFGRRPPSWLQRPSWWPPGHPYPHHEWEH